MFVVSEAIQQPHLWTEPSCCRFTPTSPRTHFTSPPLQNTAQAGLVSVSVIRARKSVKMSDMEDDFMCDDEEDYDLVTCDINIISPFARFVFNR